MDVKNGRKKILIVVMRQMLFFWIIGISGCDSLLFPSNVICFDIKEQSVKSCSSKGIRKISIVQDSTEYEYSIVWNGTGSEPPKGFRLSPLGDGYSVYTGYPERRIDSKSFKLKPYSKYVIERSGGDAGAYHIDIWTDGQGKIIKADPESCPNRR